MLTSYRIFLSDGTSYVTSMAANVTLEQARKYFIGNPYVREDHNGNETHLSYVRVEPA